MKVHQLLSNSYRTELIGQELWLDTSINNSNKIWKRPKLGFRGRLYLGHRTEVVNPAVASIEINGKKAIYEVKKHLWTPAYQQTLFYFSNGLFLQETKWIHENALLSESLFYHNSPKSLKITLHYSGAFIEKISSSKRLVIETSTSSLRKRLSTSLYFASLQESSIEIKPRSPTRVRFIIGIGITEEKAHLALKQALSCRLEDVIRSFESWFKNHVPALETSDFDLLRLYYYRWFVVYRNIHTPSKWYSNHPMQGSLVYESPVGSWFSAPIGLPLPLQIKELTWMRESYGAPDTLKAWLENHGALRAYVSDPISAGLDYNEHHPKELDLEAFYHAGKGYFAGDFPRSACIVGGSFGSFPIIIGSWVTGTEYAPDFFGKTNPPWDHTADKGILPMVGEEVDPAIATTPRVYRLDANTFHITQLLALVKIARLLKKPGDEVDQLQKYAENLLNLLENLHCDSTGIFHSVDERSKAIIHEVINFESILPFLVSSWDETKGEAVLEVLSQKHLLAPMGVTSTSQSCEAFSPNNSWEVGPKASREQPFHYPCCWNGPCWNFAISWTLLALGNGSKQSNNPKLREKFQIIWTRWNHAHFPTGDPSLPLVMEHYHPYSGEYYRNVPDYFHSAWIDIFVRFVLGLDDKKGWLSIDPLISLKERIGISELPWRGGLLTLKINNKGKIKCLVKYNGKVVASFRSPAPWHIKTLACDP
ncbi:MAG: hypothetical protein ACFFGZ_07870 [Candidatus Thorarchaeota archaeon]